MLTEVEGRAPSLHAMQWGDIGAGKPGGGGVAEAKMGSRGVRPSLVVVNDGLIRLIDEADAGAEKC